MTPSLGISPVASPPDIATRLPLDLRPDPSRVVTRLFVPGHHLLNGPDGQVSGVLAHLLALEEPAVSLALAEVMARFGDRHPDLPATVQRHAERIGHRLRAGQHMSEDRWALLGALFTHEFSVEAAALCNPSMVPHPVQDGVASGSLRFVMGVRQIGEGHQSSIGLRTGVVDADGGVVVEDPGPHTVPGAVTESTLDAQAFDDLARLSPEHAGAIAWVLERLEPCFTKTAFQARLAELWAQQDTRPRVQAALDQLRERAARSYRVTFPTSSRVDERVLQPVASIESNGLEDARFVRFVEDDGTVAHLATYTAYDGQAITLQLLRTTDFTTFEVSPLLGAAAANKGLALFPRRVAGRYVALSRHDGATNAIAFADRIDTWPSATPLLQPVAAWEAVQVGNCGPPIETDAGWLVLTHGVGPMRSYAIGAWLLDLEDPTTVIARLPRPVLSPSREEQDGYVPNVVYSCGALRHGAHIVIPYGIGDARIGIARVGVDDLLASMRPVQG